MPYRIVLADGTELTGRTDREGKTEAVMTADPQSVRLYWEPDAYPESNHEHGKVEGC